MSKTLEELGYEKILDDELQLIYENDDGDAICFVKFTKCFSVKDCYDGYQVATMEELKAIYKYCEDMGWLNEV